MAKKIEIKQEADGTIDGGVSPTTGERMYVVAPDLMTDEQLKAFSSQFPHSFVTREVGSANAYLLGGSSFKNSEGKRINEYNMAAALNEASHMIVDRTDPNGWRLPDSAEKKVLEERGFRNLETETAKATAKADAKGHPLKKLQNFVKGLKHS